MNYLSQGDVSSFMLWLFNEYLPYGIMWLLIGIAIFSTSYQKSKSAAISGFTFSMFLAIINAVLPPEVQAYFTILVGVLLFMVIYRIVR